MTIRFFCPTCNTTIESPDDQSGQVTGCMECGERLRVPIHSNAEALTVVKPSVFVKSIEKKPRPPKPVEPAIVKPMPPATAPPQPVSRNLFSCPDCGKPVSCNAYACPTCGRKIRSSPINLLAGVVLVFLFVTVGLPLLFLLVGLVMTASGVAGFMSK